MGNQQKRRRLGRDSGLKILSPWRKIKMPVPPASQVSFTSLCTSSFPAFLEWLTIQSQTYPQSMDMMPYGNGCTSYFVSIWFGCCVSASPFLSFFAPLCLDRSRKLIHLKALGLSWIHLVAYWLGPYLWLHVGSNLGPLVRIPIEWLHAHEQISRVWHVKRTGRTWKGKSEAPESQKEKGLTPQPTAKRSRTCKATPQIKCKTTTTTTEPG